MFVDSSASPVSVDVSKSTVPHTPISVVEDRSCEDETQVWLDVAFDRLAVA